jgi:hypothetical protein
MKKLSLKKKLACGVVAVAACAAVAVPLAYGQWYVAGNSAENSTAKGVMEVHVTVDDSAKNGHVYTKLVFVPSDATVEDVLDEMVISSNNQNGLKAIHNYDFKSIKKKVSKGDYKVTVYNAESQAAGTQTTHDGKGTAVSDYSSVTLSRYDNVVFKLKK